MTSGLMIVELWEVICNCVTWQLSNESLLRIQKRLTAWLWWLQNIVNGPSMAMSTFS